MSFKESDCGRALAGGEHVFVCFGDLDAHDVCRIIEKRATFDQPNAPVPAHGVTDDLASGRLIPLLPDYRPVEFAMNVVYPHRHHLSAKVRMFIDLLAQHSADHQRLMNPNG